LKFLNIKFYDYLVHHPRIVTDGQEDSGVVLKSGATNVFFLGAFAKFGKATISFAMSVRLEQIGFHWTDFHEI
jgi:hypothetical protein